MDIDKRIATIVDAVEEAYVCIAAAMRFAEYLTQDRNEEKRLQIEAELPCAKAWIETAMEHVEDLKKGLKE